MNIHLAVILLYAASLVGLGVWVSRRVETTGDFFVAGRRLSSRLLFATLLAANIGAGSTVGAAALGYQIGLSGWWWVGSAGLGQLILAVTVGPRIWRLASRLGFYTLGDFLEHRYSRGVRGTVAVVLWLASLTILAGQLIGIAWILNVVTGAPKFLGCVLGGLCVTLYFAAGGLWSAAWVNVVQLLVKLAGFGLALPMALAAVGGWQGIEARLDPGAARDSFLSFTGIGASGILAYLLLLTPSFIVSPGLLQKIYGARSESAVRTGTALNGAVLLLFSFAPVTLGMVAAAVYPGLAHGDLALPTVMTGLLPVWVGAVALAAIFSAEVSSADAVLFMLTTSLSKDLYKGHLAPEATEAQLLRVSRSTSLAAGLLGIGLAILLPTVISALTVFYSLLTVSLLVPVVAGLYTARGGAATAMTSIVLSVATTGTLLVAASGGGIWGLSPVICGLLVSAAVYLPALLSPQS